MHSETEDMETLSLLCMWDSLYARTSRLPDPL